MRKQMLFVLWSILLISTGSFAITGSGTEADPWLIESLTDFNDFAADSNYWNGYTSLETDINLIGIIYTTAVIAPDTDNTNTPWIFDGPSYTGVFNGNGYKISNLTIDTADAINHHLGLFGEISGPDADVKNLGINNCNIIGGDDSYYLGSLCGGNDDGNISNCYSTGMVVGGNQSVVLGGLCGENDGTINNCYSTVIVVGGNNSEFLGGLCGRNYYGDINNCYATGAVTGGDNSEYLGGLCGNNKGTIINCFWDVQTSGMITSAGGTSKTTLQMQDELTFFGWNDGSWTIDQGNDYPRLSHEGAYGSPITTDYPIRTYNGSGTKSDPYTLRDTNDIICMSLRLPDWKSHFILTANVDMSGILDYCPVVEFSGNFDGQGFVIYNLVIDCKVIGNRSYLGFIGKLANSESGSTITNLGIENVSIIGEDSSCYLGGLCGYGSGTIDNCYSTGMVVGGNNSNCLGNLLGLKYGNTSNCYSTGTVTGLDHSTRLGGLCGYSQGTISNSYSTGTVTGGDNSTHLGGLCGSRSNGTISNCYATGEATGGNNSEFLGGLCGSNSYSGIIIDCYATSTVNGGDGSEYIGGLIGRNYDGSISNCYSTGAVTGGRTLGGLCGGNTRSSIIIDCHATGNVTGENDSENLGGLCGANHDSSNIRNSYATGEVANGSHIGGLCGINLYNSNISNCYAIGKVIGGDNSENLGGLCGQNIGDSTITNCYSTSEVAGGIYTDGIGGLCGRNEGTISDCYAAGEIARTEGSSIIGGLCGQNEGSINNCFWDMETSGMTTSSGGIGKATTEMRTRSTFTNVSWDFNANDGDSVKWFMPLNDYPELFWQVKIWYDAPADIALEKNECGITQMAVYSLVDETLNWTLSRCESCQWITSVDPNSGSSSGPTDKTTVDINIDAVNLDAGDHTCDLILVADNGDSVLVPVSLHVYKHIGFEEFALLSQYWMMTGCDETQLCSAVDWYVDGVIDNFDLTQLAISWLGEDMITDSAEIRDGFETGDFTSYPWQLSGDANWQIVSDTVHVGSFAAESGDVSDGQSSAIELTLDTTFENISFFMKVSSENNYDYLRFYIDGTEQDKWCNDIDWTEKTYPIIPGEHTFKWSYTKDGSVSNGLDCGWIDEIKLH